ncbi:MAG TPA: hypothetical protein VG737_09985 [Cyclobacteriaceae bacterium]|nr:hypothetical protein [Cyclobacteriaceae bacterium]
MKTRFLALTILISVAFTAVHAQQDSVRYRHDIGFNTMFILQGIFDSGNTPFNIMYKKYVASDKAIRLGLNATFSLNNGDEEDSPVGTVSDRSSANISLIIGRERQNSVNTRWIWYYGAHVVPSYFFDNVDYYLDGQLNQTYESSSLGISLRPFLGIRFNINNRLYLSAESRISLDYRHSKNFGENVQTDVIINDTNSSSLSFAIFPASGLFLFYRF